MIDEDFEWKQEPQYDHAWRNEVASPSRTGRTRVTFSGLIPDAFANELAEVIIRHTKLVEITRLRAELVQARKELEAQQGRAETQRRRVDDIATRLRSLEESEATP